MNIEERLAKLHRITGIFLLIYLIFHVLNGGPIFTPLDMIAVVAFTFHSFNGMRLVLLETGLFVGSPRFIEYPYQAVSLKRSRFLVYLSFIFMVAFLLIVFVGKGV